MSSTFIQMTTKSKEDVKSMIDRAMTLFSDSSKSVAANVNSVFTAIEKVEDRKRKLESEGRQCSDLATKKRKEEIISKLS